MLPKLDSKCPFYLYMPNPTLSVFKLPTMRGCRKVKSLLTLTLMWYCILYTCHMSHKLFMKLNIILNITSVGIMSEYSNGYNNARFGKSHKCDSWITRNWSSSLSTEPRT